MASPRLCALSVTALLVLGLSACDSTPEPVKTPPPSIGISAPSDGGGESGGGGERDGGGEETASGPEDIPAPDPAGFAGMDEETPEGAEQAYRYYWAVLFWGLQTGDTSLMQEMQMADCEACRDDIAEVADLRENDEYWSATQLEDVSIELVEKNGGEYVFAYDFYASAHSEYDRASDSRVNEGKLLYSSVGGIEWNDGRWMIVDYAVMSDAEGSE